MIQQSVPVLLAFGANLGDRATTIRDAQRQIQAIPGVTNFKASRLFESVALTLDGLDSEAPRYLNAVASCTTGIPALHLLKILQQIENSHGRTRETRWGDRTLDIDIITYGGRVIDEPELKVPHPRAYERDFVLQPWLDFDPHAVLMGHGRVHELLQDTNNNTVVYNGPDSTTGLTIEPTG